MSNRVDTPTLSRDAAADTAKHLIVKIDSNDKFAIAGASDADYVGPMIAFTAQDKPGTAWIMKNKPGTVQCVASVAIAINGDVFLAANGKVAATGSVQVGQAIEAAAADGDVIAVRP